MKSEVSTTVYKGPTNFAVGFSLCWPKAELGLPPRLSQDRPARPGGEGGCLNLGVGD